MARNRKLIKEQQEFILSVYHSLSQQGKTHEEIIEALRKEYHQFLTATTMERIIFGHYYTKP